MKEFWNERYAAKEYAYGKEPNVFLKETLEEQQVKGKILFPAEGEGRNAIYAATLGLEVDAFDISEEGRVKALELAAEEGVSIDYQVGDFLEMEYEPASFDVIALIYAHFPPPIKRTYYDKLNSLLKPGGHIILEGFSLSNISYRERNPKIGGPDKPELLFTTEGIMEDFNGCEIVSLEDVETELNEGLYHVGKGKVVQFIGRKKA